FHPFFSSRSPIVPHGARVEMNGLAPALALVCCGESAARGGRKECYSMKKKSTNTMSANISKEMRREVYRRDGFRCALCDSTDVLQIHHIKPRGRGGADHPHNLITLCWRCHSAAHGSLMMLDDYAIKNSGFETEDDAIRAMVYDMELECIRYVADYYAEQGEVWYPWDG
ncbi:MAG: HNH endonuclease, partial [Oscillospiraceae bacterium]|nr:HNH endonuclease [Oscillospiraceae bacterium]